MIRSSEEREYLDQYVAKNHERVGRIESIAGDIVRKLQTDKISAR